MVFAIIIITCIVSFAALRNEALMQKLIFNPYLVAHRDEWQRLLSCGFIHADWIHLFVNMFVLMNFGPLVLDHYGLFFGDRATAYFLILYLGAIPASILPTYSKHKLDPHYNALGASGAISAVLFSYILFRPADKVCLWGVFCLPGIILGLAYLAYSYYAARKASDNINHDAHFWGAVYGVVLTLLFEPSLGIYFMDQVRAMVFDFINI